MKTKIRVTPSLIKQGKPCKSDCCPIALAIREVVKKTADVIVGVYDVTIDFDRLDLPPAAEKFVENFDLAQHEVKPFSFSLDIPSTLLKRRTRK